jgi:hypothetical protein
MQAYKMALWGHGIRSHPFRRLGIRDHDRHATRFGDLFRQSGAGRTMTTVQLIRDDQAGPGAVAATELHDLLQRQLGD